MDTQKDPEMYAYLPPTIPPSNQIEPFHINLHTLYIYIVAIANAVIENSISGKMTGALTVYSAVFARYALAVTPKNYLLFACHAINFSAQATQGVRYLKYWQYVFPHHTHTHTYI